MSQRIIDNLQNEDITLASIGKRAIAWGIDKVLLSILFYVIYADKFQNLEYEEIIVIVSKLAFDLSDIFYLVLWCYDR